MSILEVNLESEEVCFRIDIPKFYFFHSRRQMGFTDAFRNIFSKSKIIYSKKDFSKVKNCIMERTFRKLKNVF